MIEPKSHRTTANQRQLRSHHGYPAALNRSWAWLGGWLLFGSTSGCLIFTDFGRRSEEDASVAEVPPPPQGSCRPGDFVCTVGAEGEPDRWRECDDGEWSEATACSRQEPFCNVKARGCVGCRAASGRCDGTRFIECDDRGEERFVADCAATEQICDFENSGLGCVDCLPGQTRCGSGDDALLICNSEFEFEAQPCLEAAGCIRHSNEPGRLDYCAECSHPETQYCAGERLYRCSPAYMQELVEDCASIGSDCVALGDAGAACE